MHFADADVHTAGSWPQVQMVGRNGYMYVCKIACTGKGLAGAPFQVGS